MMHLDAFFIFLVTTFVVVLSPGPAAIAVATEAASTAYRRSFLIILGIALANVVFFVLSATGIAALILASENVFNIIKWIGIAYLVYLGTSAIFSKSGALNVAPSEGQSSNASWLFTRGFILEISNPKALLYFSALLPQFIDITLPTLPQMVIMCSTTLVLDLIGYSFYGLLGARVRRCSVSPKTIKLINHFAGGALLFAGAKMAFMS